MKLPILCSIFIASPWILYQVWAFIAPGLYKRERRWAAPFVICSAGLFILGGAFAYVLSTSDPIESPRWAWRDEKGADVGIAGLVGQRRYLKDQ